VSRTDKTRPYDVKLRERQAADPYRARRAYAFDHDTALAGCAHSCWMCRGPQRDDRRRTRREGRKAAQNWD
jgi:hypothetical protein